MAAFTNENSRRIRGAADTQQKPAGLAAQLLAAVETFGVGDTRAALREARERDAGADQVLAIAHRPELARETSRG